MTTRTVATPLDATLPVAGAARLLGVHANTVRAWSEQGRLRYYRINARGDRRYRVEDLERFLADAVRGAATPEHLWDGPNAEPAIAATARAASAAHVEFPNDEQALPPVPAVAIVQNAAPARHAVAVARPRTARPARVVNRHREHGIAVRHLVELAEFTAAGRPLDAMLHGAARLVRDAAQALDVSVWEVRDDRLIRRAGAGAPTAGSETGDASLGPEEARDAVAHRRPVVAPVRASANPYERPAGRAGLAAASPAVDVAVPIGGDAPWGALIARLTAVRPGPEVVGWLEAAAAILAAAIRARDLVDQAALEVQRAAALRRVAMDTAATLDLDETFARIVDHAMVLFGADRAGVFVRQPNGELRAGVSRGLSAPYLAVVKRFPVPSLPAEAAAQRRPLYATNYGQDERTRTFRAAVVQEGFDTICSAPLLDGDDTIGVLNLYHDRPKVWTQAELDTMAAFASQVTVAVRAAQQYGQLARWAAQLQSIQQLGSRLNRLTTIPEIASAIATELGVLIEYDNVRVYRLDGDDLNAVALNAVDRIYDDETPDAVHTRVGEGITGWVAAHGVAQNIPDTDRDPRVADIPGSDVFDESMLLAPLIFEDRVLGVVALARRGLDMFRDDDLRLLEIYAAIAAQAMANADATERLRAQSETLQRQLRSQRELLQITESILSTLDSGEVLDQIAERLGRLVRYDALAIAVHDKRTGNLARVTTRGMDGTGSAIAPSIADDPLAQSVIRENRPRLVAADQSRGGASRIIVPLRAPTGVTGVLGLLRTHHVASFTDDEFELVQLFAAQVSIALENAETHRAVEVRARTDDLTGLLNHGTLREWLAQSAASGKPFSLIMLDLDAFKSINDAHGHQAGDRLLNEIATAITAVGRENDLVFRYGGDEFAVLLPGANAAAAMAVAERLRNAVRTLGSHRGPQRREVEVTASFGVATFPEDGGTAADILLAADRACFVAKRAGRDRIADAAHGLALAAEFSLHEPTPVDSSDPHWNALEPSPSPHPAPLPAASDPTAA